jgi:DNA-binding transcriptional LysR family regulator
VELRQLRHLTAVLQRASFSAAATELNITQPALSKSLRTLETSLGVRLLDRGPNGVRATVYGEQLAAYAHLVLAQVAEAEQEIEALRGARKGRLRIGAVPASLRTIVPVAARNFLADRPDVQLSIVEALNDVLLGSLQRGALDLVISVLPAEPFPPEIESRVLTREPMAIVGQPGHPLAGKSNLALADLCDFSWVVPERLEPDRRQLDRLFGRARLPLPKVVMETTSVTLLPAMLSGTTFLSYLPASSVQAGGCVALPLSGATWMRTTVAAFRQKGPLRPLLGRFLSAIEAAARELPEGQGRSV